jgi:hypothetical protein
MAPAFAAIDSGVNGLNVEPETVFESDQLNIATRYFQAGQVAGSFPIEPPHGFILRA